MHSAASPVDSYPPSVSAFAGEMGDRLVPLGSSRTSLQSFWNCLLQKGGGRQARDTSGRHARGKVAKVVGYGYGTNTLASN